MKHLILSAVAAVAVSSCTFIRVNGRSLEKIFDAAEDTAEAVFEGETTGTILTKDIPVARFDGLILEGAYDVHYTIGEPSLRIHASDKVLAHIVAGVHDGVLKIGTDGTKFRNMKNVDVYLSSWSLNSIDCRGAVDFEAKGGISAEDFVLNIAGAADVEIYDLKAERSASFTVDGAGDIEVDRLETPVLKVQVNGAGDAEFSGRADKAEITINGMGDVDIISLACPDVKTSRNGLGRIKR